MTPLKDYSIPQLQEAITIKRDMARLQNRLEKLGAQTSVSLSVSLPAPKTEVRAKRKYTMTAAKLEALAKAQAARWPKSNISAQKRRITPEVRAKMSLAAKARWIARKAKAKSQAKA